jgi:hypothetical protein
MLAMRALRASGCLLLPVDATAGWVREGGAAVWRLAADMAREAALQTLEIPVKAATGFGGPFSLLEAELRAGGKASPCLFLRLIS